jgi:hypothetical protein
MTTKDWFALAVRILGLVFLYHALTTLPLMFSMFGGAILLAVVQLIWSLALAVWLMRGAPLLMHIAFPE